MGDVRSWRRRLHVRCYRALVRILPRSHRVRHGDQQVQLFADLIARGTAPWRLWANSVPDLLLVVLRTSDRRSPMSQLARALLVPLSVLNAGAGSVLAAIAIFSDAVPMWVAAPAAAVVLQGGFTLAWLAGKLPLAPPVSSTLLTIGEGLALVVGAVGVVAAVIEQSGTVDPEYGPPTILALIAIHGAVGLVAALPGRPAAPVTR